MPAKQLGHRETPELRLWRLERLLEAGFPTTLARLAAHDPAYDLHALIELVERGCPPTLAIRILAPIEIQEAG
jgi:hypothetical protein